jgi:Major capsid protein Gp23
MNPRSSQWGTVIFLLVAILLIGGIAVYDQTNTSSNDALGISVSGFQFVGIKDANSSGSTVVVLFEIRDKTPIGGIVKDAVFNLYADGNYVGRGALGNAVSIPANGAATAEAYLLLPVSGTLHATSAYFLDLGMVTWRASGNATLSQSILGTIHVGFSCNSVTGTGQISCSYVLT